jgi:hypothetical protein
VRLPEIGVLHEDWGSLEKWGSALKVGRRRGGIFPSPKSGDGGGLTVFTGPFLNFAAAKSAALRGFGLKDAENAVPLPSGRERASR